MNTDPTTPRKTPRQSAAKATAKAAPNAETMTIREMCDTFQVTARTLRFYESIELLAPIREGARRLFTRRDRARLRLILRGKRFGFSLEDIRQLLNMYEPNGSNAPQLLRTIEIGRERLAQMQAQRADLDIAIAELTTQLKSAEDAVAAFGQTADDQDERETTDADLQRPRKGSAIRAA